ncbi:MAG TPA: ABATE domain-containing protein, partial [Longimicrobiaceae bacterium]|nr:ABATE domain-containing protein [Longimicrobiaceae bacterium]
MSSENHPLSGLSLVGGRLCLDFANTVGAHDPAADEKLGGYAELVWWGLHGGALDEAAAGALLARGEARPGEAAAVHARAL